MNMNELDDFLDRTGIELFPYQKENQKEILKHAVAGEKLYAIFPPTFFGCGFDFEVKEFVLIY